MVAETAALRLGTTVANAAGQWWLGSRQRQQERQLSMEELVRVKLPGIRLQREVRQQFEKITNAVYDRLEPFLRQEFPRLTEKGWQAVIDAVADTFAHADLTDEALLAANAHPAELIRRITGSMTPPTGLNEVETRLYERLLAECVEYYVRIVRSLPVFEERAVAELLIRTATLGTEVARILERLPDRSLLAPDGTDQDTAFRREYLELVSRDLDEVELFRRTSDRAAAPRVRLSVAYVSLRAGGTGGARGTGGVGGAAGAFAGAGRRHRTDRSLPPLRLGMSDWEKAGSAGSGMRVETALSGTRRVLLRGEAGSGKTTLLRWLAVMAARGAFTGELAEWNGLTPVLIKLREYGGGTPPNPEAMLDRVAGPIVGIMPRGWVERQLAGGNALLLIDGVDELPERERRAVREWLRKLLGRYGSVRTVVTSRPAAAGADWLRHEGFSALHLDRMTPSDLAAFVRQWHQAVRELGDELPCTVDQLPLYEQSLLAGLKDRPHLQSLAGTPLLAAMLCAMHLHRGRQLPRDRMELYRNALHTLVHDRDADRNVPSALASGLSLADKLVLLRDLAWRLSDNNRSEIALEQAAGHVTAKLRAMRHLDDLDGARVLEQLRERSGVLRSPADDRLDFVHRTFQEYLAAKEATEEDRIGNLVGRAHLDLWRETIIMAAGHATTRQREELLHGILDRADTEPRPARTLRLLAAACQETLPTVSVDLAARLDAAVDRLLPARRETDPPALAAVGPTLLRSLPRSLSSLTEKAAIQTVRTVALIGGEEGLERLGAYVGDERDAVIDELIQAWAYFEAESYVDAVLSRLPLEGRWVYLTHSGQLRAVRRLSGLTNLRVECLVDRLDFLVGLPPLRKLQIMAAHGVADLTVLRDHPGLRWLFLFGPVSVRGRATLKELKELRHLALPDHADLDLNKLHLLGLASLALHKVRAGSDLGPLTALSGLEGLLLEVSAVSRVRGFEELAGMTSLSSLTFFRADAAAWLRRLRSTPPVLSRLDFYGCVVPHDPDAFARLDGLERITFAGCRTSDGDPLTEMAIPGVRTTVN
ncbi:NACHT domain-containing protein [Streptomyces sp. NPDC000594]|uniref:NACHT domain-containing protein n=1 Tax=Streptomyces sp. NPDC000594 TaxID=3154261 RepID=UPI003329F6B3